MNLQQLREKRAQVLREADAFKGADGAFKDDQARAAFDAKMAEVDSLDAQIRTAAAAPTPAVVVTETPDQIRAAERGRINGITDAVRLAKLPPAFGAELVQRGVSLDEARAAIFTEMEKESAKNPTRQHVDVVPGEDAHDKFVRGVTNWLLVRSGAAKMIAQATKTAESTIDPGEFRGLTLLDLARTCLERAGINVRGLEKMDLIGRALTLRSNITQSTSDFATLLENTMHKTLQAAYAIQPDTWRRFCAESTVSDFRAHNRYRMGSFGSLDALNENGEFKRKAITDAEKNTITATTKGNIISVSRQMIVNDDMNAFSRLPQMFGRAAALSVEVDVYATLALNGGLGPTMPDTLSLFHATHANISTGAALSAAAIDADRVAMASQKDKDANDYLDLRPAILLLPVGLGGVARVINGSLYDPDTVANKAQMKPNVVAGLFRDVCDTPRLTGTRRYLFADPGIAPVLEVAFLEGQSAPVLETKDGWNVDGAEMKVRLDYGVAGVDYRGAVTNAGV